MFRRFIQGLLAYAGIPRISFALCLRCGFCKAVEAEPAQLRAKESLGSHRISSVGTMGSTPPGKPRHYRSGTPLEWSDGSAWIDAAPQFTPPSSQFMEIHFLNFVGDLSLPIRPKQFGFLFIHSGAWVHHQLIDRVPKLPTNRSMEELFKR